VIDLHLHTTASDGRLTPDALVARASAAGLTIISVTDHDTTAALADASAAAVRQGVRLVTGIEITAVAGGRDVHILGYFLDPEAAPLETFLRQQRADRVARLREMAARLRTLGVPIDERPLEAGAADSRRSVGRPALADALVAGGHAEDREDAFERWLAHGRPAFVPRRGASPARVIDVIHEAGGLASLAHPGLLADDTIIGHAVADGLDALEVWHSDHDASRCQRYAALADRFGLAKTGGSDYHGDDGRRAAALGAVTVPPGEFLRLEAMAGSRQPHLRAADGPPAGRDGS
jgi:3',5'-nucleoside bisphosphate phosphatase